MTFGERLIELRKEKGFTQKHVANIISVTQPTYAQYEADRRKPGVETLIKIAHFFEVTTDYLLGLDDVRAHDSAELSELLADKDNCLFEFTKCLHDVYNMIGDVLYANQTQSKTHRIHPRCRQNGRRRRKAVLRQIGR